MKAICETKDCMNSGIPIEIPDDSVFVICGPCGNEITQIEDA